MAEQQATPEFSKWAMGYSGCDGGDLGSPQSPSIWVCGIEWGGGDIDGQWLKEQLISDASEPGYGYDTPEINLSYTFNRQTTKLLCAINGIAVESYEDFARKEKPFVKSQKGYFKMNLYPLSFKNTGDDLWKSWLHELTGFSNKKEYMEWCKKNRFIFLSDIKRKHKPRLIICFGRTYKDDFKSAFCEKDTEERKEKILDRELIWYRSDSTIVAVCPFPTGPHGLNSNILLQEFGKRISSLLESKSVS